MEWIGLVALAILLCYSAYPGKVRRLEAAVKKFERKQRGESGMSKLIEGLVNKECIIETDSALQLVGSTHLRCFVLDADDEWIKLRYTDRKGKPVTKLLRLESIDKVEIAEE